MGVALESEVKLDAIEYAEVDQQVEVREEEAVLVFPGRANSDIEGGRMHVKGQDYGHIINRRNGNADGGCMRVIATIPPVVLYCHNERGKH